ncbi:MAG: type I-B CRISPR-associated protein Cas8b1/Cst1 [Aggregatilineales bacterium]
MLFYTGHVFVDVGIAAITAYSRRTDPTTLTEADLDAIAAWLEMLYTQAGPMRTFARSSVFFNAGYLYPSKQRAYCERVLYAWRPGTPTLPGERCLFCDRPAAYHASREEVPMLNGRDIYNFSPAGSAGVPICGCCSLAIQALPLGCVKSGNGLLAAHSDSPAVTFQIAQTALRRLQTALTLIGPEDKLPGAPYERTRLVELLIGWLARADRNRTEQMSMPSLTGYFFTNYGSSPSIRIYRLSSDVIGFLASIYHNVDGTLVAAWQRAEARAWVRPKKVDNAGDSAKLPDRSTQANRLYESLLTLPDSAHQILYRDLLRTRHWGLVTLFVRKVMGMDPERIKLLESLGVQLADYAKDRRAFFYQFSRTEEYSKWRRLLLRASDDHMRQTGQTLITFAEFVTAFTAPPGEINDWRLARDLVTLKLIEMRAVGDEALFEDEDIETEDSTHDQTQKQALQQEDQP